jgi:hypothetical protein
LTPEGEGAMTGISEGSSIFCWSGGKKISLPFPVTETALKKRESLEKDIPSIDLGKEE